jgi:hypothetical protein
MGLFCLKSHLFHPFPGSLYALIGTMRSGLVSLLRFQTESFFSRTSGISKMARSSSANWKQFFTSPRAKL